MSEDDEAEAAQAEMLRRQTLALESIAESLSKSVDTKQLKSPAFFNAFAQGNAAAKTLAEQTAQDAAAHHDRETRRYGCCERCKFMAQLDIDSWLCRDCGPRPKLRQCQRCGMSTGVDNYTRLCVGCTVALPPDELRHMARRDGVELLPSDMDATANREAKLKLFEDRKNEKKSLSTITRQGEHLIIGRSSTVSSARTQSKQPPGGPQRACVGCGTFSYDGSDADLCAGCRDRQGAQAAKKAERGLCDRCGCAGVVMFDVGELELCAGCRPARAGPEALGCRPVREAREAREGCVGAESLEETASRLAGRQGERTCENCGYFGKLATRKSNLCLTCSALGAKPPATVTSDFTLIDAATGTFRYDGEAPLTGTMAPQCSECGSSMGLSGENSYWCPTCDSENTTEGTPTVGEHSCQKCGNSTLSAPASASESGLCVACLGVK